MQIGELFILGFFGKTIPAWLQEFAERYSLGGVILFDYSCQTREYDNNIETPEQVGRPKESRGFAPLPSAKEFNHLVQVLQKALGTREANLQSLRAGMDMLCIGNNLFDQEQDMAGIAEYLRQRLQDATLHRPSVAQSIERVQRRKSLLA